MWKNRSREGQQYRSGSLNTKEGKYNIVPASSVSKVQKSPRWFDQNWEEEEQEVEIIAKTTESKCKQSEF